MQELVEGTLTFTFPEPLKAQQYDDWSFYRNQFNRAFGGTKAVDFVCLDQQCTWLIEVKDYRVARRSKPSDLGDEVAAKVRDTLAGLVAASCNANDLDERRFAQKALKNKCLRVVLHLEQRANPSRLFPQVANPANLQMRLKQLLKAVDAHPLVVDKQKMALDIPWTVQG